MKIELTDDEAVTVLIALDNYREQKEEAWSTDGFESDQQDAASAEGTWQKIMGVREIDRINAEIRARSTLNPGGWSDNDGNAPPPGWGDTNGERQAFASNTQPPGGTSASVDPFDLSGYEDMGDD